MLDFLLGRLSQDRGSFLLEFFEFVQRLGEHPTGNSQFVWRYPCVEFFDRLTGRGEGKSAVIAVEARPVVAVSRGLGEEVDTRLEASGPLAPEVTAVIAAPRVPRRHY